MVDSKLVHGMGHRRGLLPGHVNQAISCISDLQCNSLEGSGFLKSRFSYLACRSDVFVSTTEIKASCFPKYLKKNEKVESDCTGGISPEVVCHRVRGPGLGGDKS